MRPRSTRHGSVQDVCDSHYDTLWISKSVDTLHTNLDGTAQAMTTKYQSSLPRRSNAFLKSSNIGKAKGFEKMKASPSITSTHGTVAYNANGQLDADYAFSETLQVDRTGDYQWKAKSMENLLENNYQSRRRSNRNREKFDDRRRRNVVVDGFGASPTGVRSRSVERLSTPRTTTEHQLGSGQSKSLSKSARFQSRNTSGLQYSSASRTGSLCDVRTPIPRGYKHGETNTNKKGNPHPSSLSAERLQSLQNVIMDIKDNYPDLPVDDYPHHPNIKQFLKQQRQGGRWPITSTRVTNHWEPLRHLNR